MGNIQVLNDAVKESLKGYQKDIVGLQSKGEKIDTKSVQGVVKAHELFVQIINRDEGRYIKKGLVEDYLKGTLKGVTVLNKEIMKLSKEGVDKDRVWNLIVTSIGYEDGNRSLAVVTNTMREFAMLDYKLTDIKDEKLSSISVELIKRIIESNKDKAIEIGIARLEKDKGLDKVSKARGLVTSILSDEHIKGLLTEKLYIILAKSEEEAKEEEGKEQNKLSIEEVVYNLFDSTGDEIAQDRLNRLGVILKDKETNNFKGIKSGIIKVGDKKGLQLAVQGYGFYISTKGIYVYNKVQKRVEELLRYKQDDDGGLLEWWFGNGGAYLQLVKFISQAGKNKMDNEEYRELQKYGDLLMLAYNRRKKLDENALTAINTKYGVSKKNR